jgi:hypothetical protein
LDTHFVLLSLGPVAPQEAPEPRAVGCFASVAEAKQQLPDLQWAASRAVDTWEARDGTGARYSILPTRLRTEPSAREGAAMAGPRGVH